MRQPLLHVLGVPLGSSAQLAISLSVSDKRGNKMDNFECFRAEFSICLSFFVKTDNKMANCCVLVPVLIKTQHLRIKQAAALFCDSHVFGF